jgi:putative PIN family toxin of toxin-antitoxin system
VPDRYVVVFDTSTIVQGLINPKGAAGKCPACFEQGKILTAVSRETLEEVEDVLSRPRLRERFRQITDAKVTLFIEILLYKGDYLRNVKKHFDYPRDPNDEPYLNLAIEVGADYIISRDNDLLDLMKWDKKEGREYQKRFRFLKIVSPEEFLRVIELSSR